MSDSRFSDLQTRVISGVLMALVGFVAVWVGGTVFAILAVILAGLMAWELYKMMYADAPDGRAEAMGIVAAIVVSVMTWKLSGWFALGALVLSAVLIGWRAPRDRGIFMAYLALALVAAHGLIVLRGVFGLPFVLWLILVVVASDVAGYFAGRVFGGPKFWPKVSPKKTWSGTVAGWFLAGCVGAVFATFTPQGWLLVPLSMLLAFAGQMGDIAESAIKRRVGVKDSSNLIPGHGGVLDRLDALIAVAALAYVLSFFGVFSPVGAG